MRTLSIPLMIATVAWVCGSGCAAPGMERTGHFAQFEAGGSMASGKAREPHEVRVISAGARIHSQYDRYGLGLGAELNTFRTKTLSNTDDIQGAMLLGFDTSVLSGQGYVRSFASFGLAVLMEGGEIDEPGEVGFFAEIRPVVIRFLADEDVIIAWAPAAAGVLVPDPTGIPLVDMQFRTTVGVELW